MAPAIGVLLWFVGVNVDIAQILIGPNSTCKITKLTLGIRGGRSFPRPNRPTISWKYYIFDRPSRRRTRWVVGMHGSSRIEGPTVVFKVKTWLDFFQVGYNKPYGKYSAKSAGIFEITKIGICLHMKCGKGLITQNSYEFRRTASGLTKLNTQWIT